MTNRYIPLNQSNKKRVWPCRAVSGVTVMVRTDQITFTKEDLSDWVASGLLVSLGAVDDFGRSPSDLDKAQRAEKAAEKPVAPDYIKIPKDTMSSFASALEGAFAKPLPVAPVVEPAPALAPAPVAEEVVVAEAEPVDEVVVVESAPAVETEESLSELTRAQLWEIIVDRNIAGDKTYRSLSKSQMIQTILAGG